MTQAERDAALRRLRDRLSLANETVVAVLSELRDHRDACAAVVEICDGVRQDAALRAAAHEIPGLPSRARLEQLLQELRAGEAEIRECRELLRQAGFVA